MPLPTVGGDIGAWGGLLNAYLLVEHDANGNHPGVLKGTGSPEGAVTAPVGTLYRRTDGAVGTSLYVKETGAGNTGWTAMASASGAADPELSAISALTSAADRLPYFTGSGTASLATFTAFARTILDDADAATVRATLGLVIDTDISAFLIALNTQTASYTLVLGDNGKVVEMNVASANTLTVPPNASVAFPIGSMIEIVQYGAGATTITAGAGVTLRSPSSYVKLGGQYSSCALRKRATNEWMLIGDLIA